MFDYYLNAKILTIKLLKLDIICLFMLNLINLCKHLIKFDMKQ